MEMIKIEQINIEEGLGLLQNVPKDILNKISSKIFLYSGDTEKIEVIIISNESKEVLNREIENLGGKYEDLGFGFGIVDIPINKIIDLARLKGIQYIELPKNLYITDSESNKSSCIKDLQDLEDLNGQGVIVGFIDSGIDFTNRAFRNEDGSTRVEYIYDLSGDGVVYNKQKINEALNSNNPYSIVNAPDIVKHGTHVAGIACAGGNINPRLIGVAPKSSIIMVKATRGNFTLSTQIMRGIKFIIDKSKELNMPAVINISLSTNDGAHNGTSLLEQYISTISTLESITIVIAAGNEGAAAHHVDGDLDANKEVFFNVGSSEKRIIINLYKTLLPDISLQIISPTGIRSNNIEVIEGLVDGNIGLDNYRVYITGPKPFDINGEIIISISSRNQYITSGRWGISIQVNQSYNGRFDMWLPTLEGLNTNTRFFDPSVLNTLGIPATVNNVISVGSYNYITNTISPFSGRGVPSVYKPIKPDLVAPGEDIYSVIPNNSSDKKTGTSMATPHVTGTCALFLQWGIVRGNDLYLYGERLKYFLVGGAKRDRTDIDYPNPSWGYGKLCARDSYKFLIYTINALVNRGKTRFGLDECILEEHNKTNCTRNIEKGYKEYYIKGLFIRKPI